MTAEWLGPIPSGNYLSGRHGYTVDTLVIHHMDGTMSGTDGWFHNPASRVSSTFGVGRDGRCVQWVGTDDVPYANGDMIANLTSETFEFEDENKDRPTDPPYPYTDAQYAAGAALIRERCIANGIPIQRGAWAGNIPGIVGHREIVSTYCCGTLNVDRLVAEALEGSLSQAEVDAINAFTQAKFDELNATIKAVARRTLRGAEPFDPGHDTPITTGEQINPSNAK